MFQMKRAYDPPAPDDGERILIDRLWPRGLSKEKAHIDEWLKELAPSTELRQWFGHDPAKWPEFQQRYREELRANKEALDSLAKRGARKRVTLIYGARDEEHNDAVVLLSLLQAKRPAAARTRKRKTTAAH